MEPGTHMAVKEPVAVDISVCLCLIVPVWVGLGGCLPDSTQTTYLVKTLIQEPDYR